jgi:hypothetical protein
MAYCEAQLGQKNLGYRISAKDVACLTLNATLGRQAQKLDSSLFTTDLVFIDFRSRSYRKHSLSPVSDGEFDLAAFHRLNVGDNEGITPTSMQRSSFEPQIKTSLTPQPVHPPFNTDRHTTQPTSLQWCPNIGC